MLDEIRGNDVAHRKKALEALERAKEIEANTRYKRIRLDRKTWIFKRIKDNEE